ncbi:MAG: undecaprenyl-diphosphatase UppP [Sphingomonadaceae bacterium]
MDIVMAIVLGVVQGLGEPLPISSSGHLILVPWLLGWPEHSLTFDVALHGGTALAIIVYFRRDWIQLAGAFLGSLRDGNLFGSYHRRMVWYIVVASVPGALAGVLFEKQIEQSLRSPWLVATLLVVMGGVMLAADGTSRHRRSLSELGFLDALLIGAAQTLALIPGTSRSGVTITAALLLQMNRADAARFSFLMSGPIVAGAFLYKMLGLLRDGFPAGEEAAFITGIAVAAVVGYAAIRFLLGYLQSRGLALFAVYRFALGAVVLGAFLTRGVA